MWARVSRFREPAGRIYEDVDRLPEVKEEAGKIAGFQGMFYLVDRESGRTMAITLWEDENAMRGRRGRGQSYPGPGGESRGCGDHGR